MQKQKHIIYVTLITYMWTNLGHIIQCLRVEWRMGLKMGKKNRNLGASWKFMRKCCHNLGQWFKISISFCSSMLMNLLSLDPLQTLTSHVTLRISGFSLPKSRNCMDYKVTLLSAWCQVSPEYIWTRGAQGQPKFPRLHFAELPGDSN